MSSHVPVPVAGSTLLYTRFPLEKAVEHLAELGFEAVDVAMAEGWAHVDPSSAADDPEKAIERIATACDDCGLDPIAVNGNPGEAHPEEQVRRVGALAAVADGIGASTITLPAAPRDTDLESDLERFRGFVMAAAGHDVTICVEAHYRQLTEDPAVALAYAERVPGLGITLDPSQFAVGPYWEAGCYDDLLEHIAHVHVRQAGDSWKTVQLSPDDDRGRIDISRLVSKLESTGYDDAVTVEYIDSLDGIDPESAERDAAAMRERISSLQSER